MPFSFSGSSGKEDRPDFRISDFSFWMAYMKNNVTAIVPKNRSTAAAQPNNPKIQPAVKKHGMDFALFITVVIICAFGLVMLFSASYYYAQNQFGDGFKYLKSQAVYTGVGIAAMIGFSFIPYNKVYKKNTFLFIAYLAILIMLALVFIPGIGIERQGARRWLRLGSFTIQPSELVRFLLVIILAKYMSKRTDTMPYFLNGLFPVLLAAGSVLGAVVICTNEKTKSSGWIIAAAIVAALAIIGGVVWYFIRHKEQWKYFLNASWIYLLILIPCVLIYKQPNLSTLILIAVTVLVMLFMGGVSLRHFGFIMFIGIILVLFMIFAEGYRSDRIQAWLHPWENTDDKSFQVVQSLYALGSGGLFGQGFNASKQKLLFLPYRESDFIFAIICEEFGFVGGALLIAAYAFIIYRGIRIALTVRDKFASLLAGGITSILAFQVILNIGVVTGLIPATGQTLPFVSAGGTSAVVFLAAMGILLNISRYTEVKKR